VGPGASGPLSGTMVNGAGPSDGRNSSKRVVGYTGHVPMAKERFGETFHRIDAATPDLSAIVKDSKEVYTGPRYVDEKNAFTKSGNKANVHSYKMA
jgi:hypothetical protein